jgi:hypothetical protein
MPSIRQLQYIYSKLRITIPVISKYEWHGHAYLNPALNLVGLTLSLILLTSCVLKGSINKLIPDEKPSSSQGIIINESISTRYISSAQKILTIAGECHSEITNVNIGEPIFSTVSCTNNSFLFSQDTSELPDGQYNITVTASTGLSVSIHVTKDTVHPGPVGSISDGSSSSLSSSPTLSWSAATDGTGTGVSYYEIAIGTSAGNTNVVSWTSVGNVLTKTFPTLNLTLGQLYYPSIRAVDGTGNIGPIVSGDGWLANVCPDQYVKVPALAGFTNSDFCIAKYEMRAKNMSSQNLVLNGNNGGLPLSVSEHTPESTPKGIPWIRINFADMLTACNSLGTGYHLATGNEWISLIRNAENVNTNWSSGSSGTGYVYSGHSDGVIDTSNCPDGSPVTYDGLLVVSACDGTNAYVGTGNNSTDAWDSGKSQRRTMYLSNGETVWDIAGNVRDVIDLIGNGSSLYYTGYSTSSYANVNSPETINVFNGTTGATNLNINWLQSALTSLDHLNNQIGQIYLKSDIRSGIVMSRGGNFQKSNKPGLYAADLDQLATTQSDSGGYRCSFTP